ncbi:hypothetical protein NSQ62_08590 [Solibacillus sp. FSL H8-0523]|uniref:hypothetical protein n=1 Tax=Solibacillus sp. FSL H8-0523 TaxID=2954511 RepID=UPI003101823F
MDYKKIIAATAVTSAAFVVPAVVGAEEITGKTELIAENTYSVGDTVNIAIQEIVETTGGVTTNDKIVAYEWYIGESTKAASTAAEFKLPLNAEGKSIKLVVTTEGKKKYSKVTGKINHLPDLDGADINYEEGTDLDPLDIIDSPRVNTTISMTNIKLPAVASAEIITGYEWYLVENDQYKSLVGENELDLNIPIEFSGKEVMFVVKTQSGKLFKKIIDIDPLTIDLDGLDHLVKINGVIKEDYLFYDYLPGDKIELILPDIYGNGGQLITKDDYEVEYNWVALNGNYNIFAIPNANTNTLIVPVDSAKKDYQQFKVSYTIKVPGINSISGVKTIDFGVLTTKIPELEAAINELSADSGYELLKTEVESLLNIYNELNATAKSSVKNYSKLAAYDQALKIVLPLNKQLTELNKSYSDYLNQSELSVKQSELLKAAKTLRQSYNKFTALQKSIFDNFDYSQGLPNVNELYEWIVKIDEDDALYSSTKAVVEFNTKVEETVFNSEEHTYQLDAELNNLTALLDMENNVNNYLDEAKTVDKAYQALLKINTLKMAQGDIKKARSVIEKINKIEPITDKRKQASAIIAAEKAYNKLNLAQTTLISETTLLKLMNPSTGDSENPEVLEDEDVVSLIERIGELQSSNMTIDDLELELSEIAIEYKLLTSAQKKLVTNYRSVSAVKKDVAAAKRVANAIVKAEDAKVDADSYANDDKRSKYISKMKSTQSKFNSAYKAYAKLTATQKALIDGAALEEAVKDIKNMIDNEEFAGKEDYTSGSTSSLIQRIEEIQVILAEAETAGAEDTLSGSDLDMGLKELLNDAKTMYKELNSFEKKLVYNYGVISTASSHLTKATNVKKRLVAATDEKKFNTAKKAFDKLQAVQKGLILATYTNAFESLVEDDSPLADLDANLSSFFEVDDLSNFDRVAFEELQNELKLLSTKELKSLKDYSKYQALLKDLKAVDSFVAKMLKLGNNPTYSKKESNYKSYLKLTRNQQQLFNSYENPDQESEYDYLFDLLDNWNKEAASKAEDLNRQIAEIIVDGSYGLMPNGDTSLEKLNQFELIITNITKDYKALDSKERKLVVNYSFLKNAEKDIKAVRKVLQLKADSNTAAQFEQAYNKLTVDQKSLYNLVNL